MQFLISTQAFVKGLKPAIDVAVKDVDKEFEFAYRVTLKANAKELTVIAFSGMVGITANISDTTINNANYSVQQAGSATVNASDLFFSVESFQDDEMLSVILDGKDLKIIPQKSPDEYQTLAVFNSEIVLPDKSKDVLKHFTVDRHILLNSIQRVFFAIGYEETRPQYTYWVLRSRKDKVRFVAGTGNQFAVLDLMGSNIVKNNTGSDDIDILFPSGHSKTAINVLKNADSDVVDIWQGKNPDQIEIKCDFFILCMVRFNPDIQYSNEDIILKRKNDLVIQTKVRDWEGASKGAMATFNDTIKSAKDYQRAEITLDEAKQSLVLRTEGSMKSKRRVAIGSIDKKPNEERHWICPVAYLNEITSRSSNKDDDVSIEFAEELKPIIVRYARQTNESTGIKEDFMMFFTCVSTLIS